MKILITKNYRKHVNILLLTLFSIKFQTTKLIVNFFVRCSKQFLTQRKDKGN
jgi:hypothetical protein